MTGGPKPPDADADATDDDDGAPKLGGPLEGKPDAAESASWDGASPSRLPAVFLPSPNPASRAPTAHASRDSPSAGASRASPSAAACTRMACGGSDGSCVVYAIDPSADDLAPSPLRRVPGPAIDQPPTRRQKNATAVVCLDSDSDTEDPRLGSTRTSWRRSARGTRRRRRIMSEVTEGGHAGAVSCVAFHPDAASFYTASSDGTCKRWKIPVVSNSAHNCADVDVRAQEDGGARRGSVPASLRRRRQAVRRAARRRASRCRSRQRRRHRAHVLAPLAGEGQGRPRRPTRRRRGRGPGGGGKGCQSRRGEGGGGGCDDAGGTRRGSRRGGCRGGGQEKVSRRERYRNKPKGFGGVNTVLCIAGGAGESGDLVFTGSRDCNVRRWAVSGDAPVVERVIPGHKAPVTAIAVSRIRSELVTGGARGDGELRHYRWQPVAGVDAEYVDGKLKSSRRVLRQGSHHTPRARGFQGERAPCRCPRGAHIPRRAVPVHRGRRGGVEVAISRWSVETGAEDKDFQVPRPTTRAASPPRASSRTSHRRDPTPPSASRRSRAPPPRARAEGSSPEAPTDASTCGPRRDTTTARGNSSRRKSPSGRRR